MKQVVKIKVRPNQRVRFPGLCVHCAQPAAGHMGLKKRIGRVTRLIDVPLCAGCAQALRRRSAEEERLVKIGWLVSGLIFLLGLALALVFTPTALPFALRGFIALAVSLFTAAAVFIYFGRASFRMALAEKKAVSTAARISNFSWRATTFEFANEMFAERFKTLNESLLMEVTP
jgi:hypothetical protein